MERQGFRNPPVNVGDELDVKIDAVGEKGDGIAKKDGFVLVIPGTQLNDEVRIRVTKVLRKVGFAEVVGEASGPVSSDAPESEEYAPQAEEPAPEDSSDESSSDDSE